MTVEGATPATPAVPAVAPRDPALVLAGLHLRLGSLALARAELETLAASSSLDGPGQVDLAEVRWRTGDLVGAGDAARVALEHGDEAVVALVVAAEAASTLGRPTEARRYASRALAAAGGPIDPVFAGMPRSGVWPADPLEPVPAAATLFPTERVFALPAVPAEPEPAGVPGAVTSGEPAPPADGGTAAATTSVAGASLASGADHGPGFWDLPAEEPTATGATFGLDAGTGDAGAPGLDGLAPPAPPSGLDPAAILDAGEAALIAGDLASAALHLGLAVRVAPSIAPVVLSAIGDTPDAGLQMVRGDAYRALGRETDARRAYEAAMAVREPAEAPPAPAEPTVASPAPAEGPPAPAEPDEPRPSFGP